MQKESEILTELRKEVCRKQCRRKPIEGKESKKEDAVKKFDRGQNGMFMRVNSTDKSKKHAE